MLGTRNISSILHHKWSQKYLFNNLKWISTLNSLCRVANQNVRRKGSKKEQ